MTLASRYATVVSPPTDTADHKEFCCRARLLLDYIRRPLDASRRYIRLRNQNKCDGEVTGVMATLLLVILVWNVK